MALTELWITCSPQLARGPAARGGAARRAGDPQAAIAVWTKSLHPGPPRIRASPPKMCYTSTVRFEWDPRKAQINKRKHDVSFEEAAGCFADSLAMVLIDHARPDRLILIGQSPACRLIFTVYAEKDADVICIISARKATRAERRKYEEGEF
jgi:uncharacterized DUF497 family protein